jgi:hypothetical protein
LCCCVCCITIVDFFPFAFSGFRNYKTKLISVAFIFPLALEDIDQSTVYVIGGLVDESIQKVSGHLSLTSPSPLFKNFLDWVSLHSLGCPL